MYTQRYLFETHNALKLAINAASYANTIPEVEKQLRKTLSKVEKAMDRYCRDNNLQEVHFAED